MKSSKFLKKYMNAYSPTGQESEGQAVWIEYMKDWSDEQHLDPYGTAYCLVKSNSDKHGHTVVIEAHADEIAWMVSQIDSDGFLRVKRNGGSDNMIAPSKQVTVITHDGRKHTGVFGYPAVHVREKYTEMGLDQHDLWVDMGTNKEGVDKMGIEVGNMVVFNDEFGQVGDYYTGRALDNKIGGYIIAEAARRIKENNIDLPFDLYVVNSVQEEVGLHGAKMIAQRLKPDFAFVHDVCHNTSTPKMNKAKDCDTKGGNGPVIEYTAQNHRMAIKLIRETANRNNIPLQLSIGSYGNDTMGFFLANAGTPTAIVATPLKYMHTTVEMAHVDDVENAIKLFIETLKEIDHDFLNELKGGRV